MGKECPYCKREKTEENTRILASGRFYTYCRECSAELKVAYRARRRSGEEMRKRRPRTHIERRYSDFVKIRALAEEAWEEQREHRGTR
jgi:hypothetical protein